MKKALWKGGGAYGLANALAAGAQFAAILIFAGALRSDDFGRLSIFSVLFIVLSMVVGLGLTAAAQHAYFQVAFDKFQLLVSTILKAVIAFAAFLALFIALVPDKVIGYSSLPRIWVLYSLAAATAQVSVQILMTVLQTQERIYDHLKIVALQIAIHLSFSIGFLLTQREEWQLAVLAQSAAPMLTGVTALLVLSKAGFLTRHTSVELLAGALRYSLPLVPHQVAGWVISMVDRFIIATHLGVAQAGIYSLSFQISQATNIVSNSFNQALVPVMFRLLAERIPDHLRIRRLNGLYAAGLVCFAAIFVTVFIAAAPFFLRPDYIPALGYTPWLILAFLLLAISRISSNFLMYYGQTGTLAIGTMLSALASVLLNLTLVPEFGVVGACWASVAAFSLLLGITTWRALLCHRQQQSDATSR